MKDGFLTNASEDVTSLRKLREEIDQIHNEVKQARVAFVLLARCIEQLRSDGSDAHDIVDDLRQTLGIACAAAPPHVPAVCANCGSHLDHHRAEAGELVICPACGWSDFVDDTAEHVVQPPPITGMATAATPGSWA